MGEGNGPRAQEPEFSSRRVVVVVEGWSPRLSNWVAAIVGASLVGEVRAVAKRACQFGEFLQDRNRHEPF